MTQVTTDSTPRYKALLAEDDTFIRDIVSNYLQRLGYEVFEASNGEKAIEMLSHSNRREYDVLVTDLLMPKACGEIVIKEARQTGTCKRFLIMTGNLFDSRFNSKSVPPDSEFLEKPFTYADFESKVVSLQKRQLAQSS